MELAVGASQATIKSLLTKLGSLLAEEYALIRGVRGDIQFISDELASMQAFLSNVARAGGADGHDDQTQDWMRQVRDVSYDIEDCVGDFAHSLRRDPRGDACLASIRRTLEEIRRWSSRRHIAVQILDLKARAQHVGERRGRYGFRDPEPGKMNSLASVTGYHAAEHQHITRQLVGIQEPVGVEYDDMQRLREWLVVPDVNKKKMASGKPPLRCRCTGSTARRPVPAPSHGHRVAKLKPSEAVIRKHTVDSSKPQANDREQPGEDPCRLRVDKSCCFCHKRSEPNLSPDQQ